jgi:hypothetical protein
MKKKIAADLTNLAHRVLQLQQKEDIIELQAIAKELYEKLTVLAFTEKHFADILPTAGNEEIERRLSSAFTEAQQDVDSITGDVEKVIGGAQEKAQEAFTNRDLSDLFMPLDDDTREEIELPGIATISKMIQEMPDELPETSVNISISEDKKELTEIPDPKRYTKNDLEEITADFQTMPIFERKVNDAKSEEKPISLNDLLHKGLKFGMNDRLGFIKHLFNGSDQDFNRVISQLNTRSTFKDAQNFINGMVKPDYNNWEGKDTYANRFMELVEKNY